MDPDQQSSSFGSPPSAALASPVPESDEDPDSPIAAAGFGSSEPLAAILPFDLIGPLLGRLIGLLAITVPLLCVLADRRPDPGQPTGVLPATLSHGAEPAPRRFAP